MREPVITAAFFGEVASTIQYSIWLLIVGGLVIALLSALIRPEGDFAAARMNKRFWMIALGAGLAVYLWPYIMPIYLPFSGILHWVSIFAMVYYLGPESQRMGALFRRRGRGGASSKGSGW